MKHAYVTNVLHDYQCIDISVLCVHQFVYSWLYFSGDVLQDCTIFNGVTYLGTVTVNAPKSETEIQRNMVDLNEQIVEGIKVSVSIPSCSDGCVV